MQVELRRKSVPKMRKSLVVNPAGGGSVFIGVQSKHCAGQIEISALSVLKWFFIELEHACSRTSKNKHFTVSKNNRRFEFNYSRDCGFN